MTQPIPNAYPTVINGAPVDADAWFNAVAIDLTKLKDSGAAWTAWTPTLTNLTQGDGTLLARYRRTGQTLDYRFRIKLGASSVVGTSPRFTLPFAVHGSYAVSEDPAGQAQLEDFSVATRAGVVWFQSGNLVEILGYSTTGVATPVTATFPHTWGVNDAMGCAGTVELA